MKNVFYLRGPGITTGITLHQFPDTKTWMATSKTSDNHVSAIAYGPSPEQCFADIVAILRKNKELI